MAFKDNFDQRVLRVDQLDIVDYDHYMTGIVTSELSKCFEYFQPGLITSIEAELKAVLSFIFWKYCFYPKSATISQQMLEIEYKSLYNDGILSNRQKILYALGNIGGEWFLSRAYDIKKYYTTFGNPDKFQSLVNIVTHFHHFLSLINFVIFLLNGRYKSLLERVLGIYAVFSKKQPARQVFFEYMNDDLLRQGFSEFLFYLLPLLNISRLRNILLRLMWKREEKASHISNQYCGICMELPTNAHVTKCGHVFCYICIKANSMTDPSFLCPVCGDVVCDNITPF